MASPIDKTKADGANKPLLPDFQRSYTTGNKLAARQMFVFNKDGTIARLKEVQPSQLKYNKQGQSSPK